MAPGLRHSILMMRELRWRELLHLHRPRWRELAPARAARIALGIALPLLIGVLTGHVLDGVFAALGALPAGLVSFQGVNRSRMEAVLVAGVGVAASTFLGATMAGTWMARVILVILWAYLTGLSVALGTRWNVVVVNWTVALLLGEAIPLPPGLAAVRAGLALAGGLLQGGLVALSWTWRPGREERSALAASYAMLASYADAIGSGGSRAPPTSALPAAAALEDPNPLIPREVLGMYVDLLEEAIRVRASLAALAGYTQGEAEREVTCRFAADAGSVLACIAAGIGAPPVQWTAWAEDAQQRVARLSVPRDANWRWAGEALLGQLRAVTRVVLRIEARPVGLRGRGSTSVPDPLRPVNWLARAVAILRANATSTTEAGRHAVRLAVAAGLAELVADLTGFPYGRWVVLTVLLVLKPDYASTVGRAVQRAVGTLLGAGLVVGLSHLLHPGRVELSLAAVVAIALAYVTLEANYFVFSLFLTAFVLLMLQLLGLAALRLAEDRIGATAIGAAWALVVYLAWPTWLGTSAPEKFAVLIERVGAYLGTLLEQLAHPERIDRERLQREQDETRRARSDADAAAERLLGEPAHPPLTSELTRSLMAVAERLALGLLAAHTLLDQRAGGSTDGAISARLDALASAFRTAFEQLATAMRTESPPAPLPPLRALQRELVEQTGSNPSLVVVTDALVDSVGSLDAVLGRGLSRAPSVADECLNARATSGRADGSDRRRGSPTNEDRHQREQGGDGPGPRAEA